MKTSRFYLLIGALSLLSAVAFAQTVVETLYRIQTDPASGRVQAFFSRTLEVNGQTFPLDGLIETAWEIGAPKTVTVGGKTYTYAEVFAAVQAIAQQERAEQKAAAASSVVLSSQPSAISSEPANSEADR